MNYARFDFLQPIRFLTDVDDSVDSDVPSAQQPNSLLAAGFSLRIRTLRSGMRSSFSCIGRDACEPRECLPMPGMRAASARADESGIGLGYPESARYVLTLIVPRVAEPSESKTLRSTTQEK